MPVDEKEYEGMVPKLRADFNPTQLETPLTPEEIDLLVVIDGQSSVSALATLKGLSPGSVFKRLTVMADKGVVDLGVRKKATATKVEGARSYVPQGPSKLNAKLEEERKRNTPPPTGFRRRHTSSPRNKQTPKPEHRARRTPPPQKPKKQAVSADAVGIRRERTAENIRPQRPKRAATPPPASRPMARRTPPPASQASTTQARNTNQTPPPTSHPQGQQSAKRTPPPASAPQNRRPQPKQAPSSPSGTYRAPTGPRRTKPPASKSAQHKPRPAQEQTAPPIPQQSSEIERTVAFAKRPQTTTGTPTQREAENSAATIGQAIPTPAPLRPKKQAATPTPPEEGELLNLEGMANDEEMQAMLGDSIVGDLQLEETKLVAHVLMSFARVTSCFQLYDPRNDAVHDALVALYRALNQCLEAHPRLQLHVEPWQFLYDGEVVYRNREREHSLAFKLYRDGIRSLTFKRGIPWQELAQFLKILGVRYHGVHMFEDDIVTLMWKADFQCIEAAAIEGFEMVEQADRGGKLTAEQVLAEALQDLKSERNERSNEALQQSLREEDQRKVYQELKPKNVAYRAIPEEHLAPLRSEESIRHYPQRALRLLDILEAETRHGATPNDPEILEPLERLLHELSDYLLTEGMLPELHGLLTRTKRWNDDQKAEHLWHFFGLMLEYLQEERQLRRLLDAAPYVNDAPEPTLYLLLELLPNAPVERLFDLLENESYKPLKRTLRHVLLALTGRKSEPFLSRMAKAETPFLVELLRCAFEIKDQASIAAIASQLSHGDPEVETLAKKLLDHLFRSNVEGLAIGDVIGQLLASPIQDIRLRGYALIQSSNDPRWGSLLLREAGAQVDWDEKELGEALRLSAMLAPAEAKPLLLEWAKPPGRFQITGEKANRKRQRIAAVKALSEIADDDAEQMLKQVIQKCPDIKEIGVAAMRDLRKRGRGIRNDKINMSVALSGQSFDALSGIYDAAETPSNAQTPDLSAFGAQEVNIKDVQEQMLRALQHASGGKLGLSNTIRKKGYTLIMQLHMLIKNSRLYDKDNRIFATSFDQFAALLEEMLSELGEIALLSVDGQLYVNETRIRLERESASIGKELHQDLANVGVGGITFLQPMSPKQLRIFIQRIARYGDNQQRLTLHDFHAELKRDGLAHLLALAGKINYRIGQDDEIQVGGAKSLLDAYTTAAEALKDLYQSTSDERAANPLALRRASNAIVDSLRLQSKDTNPLEMLALASPSAPMQSHLIEVSMYATMIGVELGLPRESLADLSLCAFFHDLGHFLPQSGPKRIAHTRRGLRFVCQQHGFQDARVKRLLGIVEHHREYQSKVKPQVQARILKVADTFSLLASPLHGDLRVSPAVALQMLWGGRKTHFDPIVVQALTNRVGQFPPGTLVKLSNKSVGVSLGFDGKEENFAKPRVLQITTAAGKRCDGPIIDLSNPTQTGLHAQSAMKANDSANKHVKHLLVKTMRDRIALEMSTSQR